MLSAIWNIPAGFATLVAGLFVIMAAGIAWWGVQRQIRATQEIEATKARLDLYNRRFEIFVSIFDFYEALIGWKGTPEQRAACQGDAQRLCGQYVPDVDRITACMSAKRRYLSPGCRAVFSGGAKRKRAGN